MPKPALKRVEELFHQAVGLPPDERPAFLSTACAGDDDLLAAVETLLRHDSDTTDLFSASPVAGAANDARRDAPTLPGTAPLPAIPDYELLRELGRGGMGVVYLARHLPLKRLVALKMLPTTSATPDQLARFRIEAEALARMQHPNVVPIYDVGEFQGHPFFTMEYVAGPSLAGLLDGRPQDVAASARLVEVLARAVDAVHHCGIIHRDLKPANVLLSFSRERPASDSGESLAGRSRLNEAIPKITDFGIAKDQMAARRLTRAGEVMGTPSYMAPEQVRNKPSGVGPAADIYSLGSVLYELLTGRPPFDAVTPVEIIAKLLNQEPVSPSVLRPRLPADLATICLKCLEKSPGRRYASARDLADDLRRFRAGEPIHARPVGPVARAYRWCLRRPLVTGLLALSITLAAALVVTVVAYEFQLDKEELAREKAIAEKEAAIAEAERREIVRLNITIGGSELEAGDTLTAVLHFARALSLDDADQARVRNHRTRIATALHRRSREVSYGSDSPEEPRAEGGPRVIPLENGTTVRVEQPTSACSLRPCRPDDRVADRAAFSPDGSRVAVANEGHTARIWHTNGGAPATPPLRHDAAVIYAAFSPDGQRLITLSKGGTARVWDALTGEVLTPPLKHARAVTGAFFRAGGNEAVVVHNGGTATVWDLTPDERTVDEIMAEVRPLAADSQE
jgi:hypothetical protein